MHHQLIGVLLVNLCGRRTGTGHPYAAVLTTATVAILGLLL